MRQLIEVTRKDIRLGVKGSCYSCPVALATKRQAQLTSCSVGEQIVGWGPTMGQFRVNAPRSVTRFIDKFDRGDKTRPFRFYLVTD